jgi:putative effector of murein hydrolase
MPEILTNPFLVGGVIVVIVPKIGGTSWVKFTDGEEIIKKGEEETRLVLAVNKRFNPG